MQKRRNKRFGTWTNGSMYGVWDYKMESKVRIEGVNMVTRQQQQAQAEADKLNDELEDPYFW